ncbi:MAG: hypothetical protein ACRDZ6_07785 [Acidimicrobiales bacterium]
MLLDDLAAVLNAERLARRHPVLEGLLEQALGGRGNDGNGDNDGRRGAPAEPAGSAGPLSATSAARRLLACSAPWALDLEFSLLELVESIHDYRDRSIFVEAGLGCQQRSSLTALAAELGASPTRVAQCRDRAAAEVRAACKTAQPHLAWAACWAGRSVGVAVTLQRANDLLTSRGLAALAGSDDAPDASDRSRVSEILLWLAGPYRADPRIAGWLVTGSDDLVALTTRLLKEDGGAGAWLGGQLYDALERLIGAGGRAMSAEGCAELLRSAGRPEVPADVARALRARRFRALPGGRFELEAWRTTTGGRSGAPRRTAPRQASTQPSSTTRERPNATPELTDHEQHLLRHLGPLGVGASDESMFELDDPRPGDPARWSEAPEPALARTDQAGSPAAASDDRIWFAVDVDSGVLAGSESAAPEALIRALGVGWRQRRTFSSRYGPVTVANDGPEPSHSSLRPLAFGAGARRGTIDARVWWRRRHRRREDALRCNGTRKERGDRVHD